MAILQAPQSRGTAKFHELAPKQPVRFAPSVKPLGASDPGIFTGRAGQKLRAS